MSKDFGGSGRKNWQPLIKQCFVTVSVALNILGHGCVIGFSATLIPSLRHPDSIIKPTPSQESWIASVVGFALIVGNFIITPLMDTWGRKKCHLLTIIPIMTGWFMTVTATSVAGLIAARFLQGIAMGMLGPLGSIIIGEMTDPRNRGAYLTSVSLALTSGTMFTHAVGAAVSWQMTALICSFITFTSLIMIIFVPESPSWLISKGRIDEGRRIFLWLRGHDDYQEKELEAMITVQNMIRKSSIDDQKVSLKKRLGRFFTYVGQTYKKPEFYKPILIMFHMYTMFQFAGMNVISSYALDIISQVVGKDANAKAIMVGLDVERLVSNVIAVFLMKMMRRRTLLFSSGVVCVLSYLGKAGYVYAKQNNALPYDSSWIPIMLIGIYMFSLAVGISSIPFAISGEIFPLEYRGLGGGISVLALSLNFFVAVKCFPVLTSSVGLPSTYLLYAGIVVYCLGVLWYMMPETKDRSLQDIEDEFRGMSRQDRKSVTPLRPTNELMMRRCSSQIIY